MTCRFYDDNRNVFLEKSANGAAEVIIVNQTGRPKSVKSNLASAESDALKQICKSLGIGVTQLREKNFNKGGQNNRSQGQAAFSQGGNGAGTRQPQSEAKPVKVKLLSQFKKRDKLLSAKGELENGTQIDVLIFQSKYQVLEQQYRCSVDQFVAGSKPGATFGFLGRIGTYNGNQQVVFEDALKAA